MKAKISQKGIAFLKSTQASKALMTAILNNSDQLFNGQVVPFKIFFHEGNKKVEKEVTVKLVTPY